MTYWDYKQDQIEAGKPIKYTFIQYQNLYKNLRMKRGRTNGGRKAAPKKFKKGYNRTGGNWGRYSGSNAELKFHDVDLNDTNVASAGTVTPSINLIPQGVTEITRVGRKCTLKKISWNIRIITIAGSSEASSDVVRFILFQDKQCNGATAAVLDILETADFLSFRNLSNTGRFRILWDKFVQMNHTAAGGNGTAIETVEHAQFLTYHKDVNIPLEFDATTGAITEIRSNNIGVLMISQGNTISLLDSKFRLRFSDGS